MADDLLVEETTPQRRLPAASDDTEVTEAVEPEAAEPEGTPAKAGRPPMKRATRIRLLVILVVALVVALAFIGNYVLNTSNYVSTDNAQIDGNQISVNAPATGTLIQWRGQQGTDLTKNGAVGRIQMQGGYVQPQMVIRAPAAGVVAVDNGVEGTFVTAGTPLAVAYDETGVFVTARVDETDIDEVQTGRAVDIEVDAFPKAKLTGRVAEIKSGAAGVFSVFPQSNTSGNFQKVTQVIPVKISIDDLQDLDLVPGMNVTVKIHRH
jgi:multidrug resistance efflux pump